MPKWHLRIATYGTVDELNSVLGVVISTGPRAADLAELLRSIQNDLFDVGADLCVPQRPDEESGAALRLAGSQVERLERAIDHTNNELPVLRSFVLPGGSPAASQLHLARTVCRRAERLAWELESKEEVNPQVAVYLNRLSDLLFVMARSENAASGREENLWEPGRSQSGSS